MELDDGRITHDSRPKKSLHKRSLQTVPGLNAAISGIFQRLDQVLLVVPLDRPFHWVAQVSDLTLHILDPFLKPLFRFIAGRLVAGSCQPIGSHFVYQMRVQFHCVATNLFIACATDFDPLLDIKSPSGQAAGIGSDRVDRNPKRPA